MTPSNYHTHTTFCDGQNTAEELVQAALKLGCPAIGFSGHSYTAFDERWCMSRAGTQAYRREVAALKEQYAGRIRICLGVEQDYYSDQPTDGYDYVIGSVHYVKKGGEYLPVDESREVFADNVDRCYGGDVYAFIEDYYAAVADLYRKTGCGMVGHFDLVMKFNGDGTLFDPGHPRYTAAAEGALRALADAPVAFEVNTGAMARGLRTEPYPARAWVERLREMGKELVFSSDCHRADLLLFGHEDYLKHIER